MTTEEKILREELILFAEWLSKQAELDVMVVDEAVDMYLEHKAKQP